MSLLFQSITVTVILFVTVVVPFIFLISICILIWNCAYIKRTDHHYALSYLLPTHCGCIYSFWVLATVLPTMVSVVYSKKVNKSVLVYDIALIMIMLQGTVSVIMGLLKPDVQKMVMNIFTGCYCCYNNHNQVEGLQCLVLFLLPHNIIVECCNAFGMASSI